MSCACGVPRKADFYIRYVIGRDVPGGTETGYVDAYVCEEHSTETPDLSDGWKVLESTEPKPLR